MPQKVQIQALVQLQEQLADGIYSLTIKAEEIAKQAQAGQFVAVYCNDGSRLLPRPISLCGIDQENGTLRLVYRIAGKGTAEFSALQPGDAVTVLGPLGNGFPAVSGRVMLIGGGIGIPPLLQLAKMIRQGAGAEGKDAEVISVLGYRNADTFLKEEFQEQGEVFLATEDGSLGTKGNVMDAIQEKSLTADVICACGPMPMLRAVSRFAAENGIVCYVSMEERMACGIGACLACVCKSKNKDEHTNVQNKRVCKEGPVFRAEEVDWS